MLDGKEVLTSVILKKAISIRNDGYMKDVYFLEQFGLHRPTVLVDLNQRVCLT